ncbi:MAG: FtsW/RodA/SpoVE family cell cycle protein [bacterium]|nr:FtsW/RodA/SpoVE family cell cycle protein [bacterium]
MVTLKLERTLLIGTVIILCLLGLFFVFESSAVESFKQDGTAFYFLKNQSLGFIVGLVAMIVAAFIPVKTYLKWPYFFYFAALLSGALCFLPGFGEILVGDVVTNGARRWIYIFGISVQVAEIMKFCLIIFFAYLFSKTCDWKVFLSYLIAPVALLLLQKDLGSLLVIAAIIFGLYFLAGADLKIYGKIILVSLIAVVAMIFLSPYRRERAITFLNPQADTQDTGYHVNQLKIGIGRGGLFGQGIGNSRQKYAYIPFASSDSIFSIISEEVGFLGSSFILLIFVFYLYLIWRIVQIAPLAMSEKLVGSGIFLLFVSQIFINLGAISGLVPLTGITLPFFSAGGSSLVISLFLTGVVISLSRESEQKSPRRKRYA